MPLRGRIGLLFVPDEETGGAIRVRRARSARASWLPTGIGMLLPEPTSGVVWHANRGAITLEVTVAGRAAHVGLARTRASTRSRRAMPLLQQLVRATRASWTRATRSCSWAATWKRARTSTSCPIACRFTIDRRTNPDEDFEAEKRALLDLIGRASRKPATSTSAPFRKGAPSLTSPDAPLARALADSIRDVTGEPPAFELCPGLLEIRFYAERGVPALAYGPGILAVSHGPQEFVKISRMVDCAKAVRPDRYTTARLISARQ